MDGTPDLIDTFTYDNLDRESTETQAGQTDDSGVQSDWVGYSYDAAGNTTETDMKEAVTDSSPVADTVYTFDHDQRKTAASTTAGFDDLHTLNYSYDADGRVIGETSRDDGGRTISYDADGRETAVTPGTGSSYTAEAYTYDAAGNRLSATDAATVTGTISHGTGNRITADGAGSYTYDLDGNRSTLDTSAGATSISTTYTFNAVGQMTEAYTTSSDPYYGTSSKTSVYDYDPATGQRISLVYTAYGTTTAALYAYDPQTGNPLLVLDQNGNVTERDLTGPNLNQILAYQQPGVTADWLISNNVGSVTDELYVDGDDVGHAGYDTFGNLEFGGLSGRFGYAGMVLDTGTGLYYDNARYYDPEQGLFVTEDPTGFGGGDYNLYRYAGGDPGTYGDPTGLDSPGTGGGSGGTAAGQAMSAKSGELLHSNQARPGKDGELLYSIENLPVVGQALETASKINQLDGELGALYAQGQSQSQQSAFGGPVPICNFPKSIRKAIRDKQASRDQLARNYRRFFNRVDTGSGTGLNAALIMIRDHHDQIQRRIDIATASGTTGTYYDPSVYPSTGTLLEKGAVNTANGGTQLIIHALNSPVTMNPLVMTSNVFGAGINGPIPDWYWSQNLVLEESASRNKTNVGLAEFGFSLTLPYAGGKLVGLLGTESVESTEAAQEVEQVFNCFSAGTSVIMAEEIESQAGLYADKSAGQIRTSVAILADVAIVFGAMLVSIEMFKRRQFEKDADLELSRLKPIEFPFRHSLA